MKSLIFTFISLICLYSPCISHYETWEEANSEKQIQINIAIIQTIEKASSSPFKKTSDIIIGSKEYKLVLKENQNYRLLKQYYNPESHLTGSVQLESMLTSGHLHLLKSTNDPSILKNMNYRLSVPEELGCSFWIIPISTYNKLAPHSLSSVYRPKNAETMDLPIVTYFGSCRFHLPFRHMLSEKRIFLNNGVTPRSNFTANETAQMLEIVYGKTPLPDKKFRKLLWNSPEQRDFELMRYADTDIFVIESCTLKRFKLHGYDLHFNIVMQRLFNREYNDGEETTHPLMPYYKFLLRKAELRAEISDPYKRKKIHPVNLYTIMNDIPENFLTEEDLYLLENIELSVLTKEEYIGRMRKVSELANGKPVLFISHVNVKRDDNETILHRELADEYIREGAEEIGQHYFRPGDLITRQYGQDNVMVSQEDICHYQEHFIPIIGDAYVEKIHSILNSR